MPPVWGPWTNWTYWNDDTLEMTASRTRKCYRKHKVVFNAELEIDNSYCVGHWQEYVDDLGRLFIMKVIEN